MSESVPEHHISSQKSTLSSQSSNMRVRREILRIISLNGECSLTRLKHELSIDGDVLRRELTTLEEDLLIQDCKFRNEDRYRINPDQFLVILDNMSRRMKHLIKDSNSILMKRKQD